MPKPLTRRNSAGEVYKRLPDVESQILRWEATDAVEVADAARLGEYDSPGYIKLEVLLYLLRSALRRGDTDYFYTVFTVFNARLMRMLRSAFAKRSANDDDNVEEASCVFAEMLAEDAADSNNELDFYEVRFGNALRYFVLDRLEESKRWYSHHVSTDGITDNGEELFPPFMRDLHELTEPERTALSAAISRSVNELSDEEQQILVLRFLKGVKISSNDPKAETISKTLGLSDRTIRNRIASAAQKLSIFKERS